MITWSIWIYCNSTKISWSLVNLYSTRAFLYNDTLEFAQWTDWPVAKQVVPRVIPFGHNAQAGLNLTIPLRATWFVRPPVGVVKRRSNSLPCLPKEISSASSWIRSLTARPDRLSTGPQLFWHYTRSAFSPYNRSTMSGWHWSTYIRVSVICLRTRMKNTNAFKFSMQRSFEI